MTAALAAALAVAVIALIALGLSSRRNSAALHRRRRAAEKTGEELARARREADEARQAADDAREELDRARTEAATARSFAEDAEKRLAEAERRAESFQAEILRAEAAAADRRVSASVTPGAGAVLWQLERLRCEREWSEVVGPGVPLPVEWDETLGAVLATEMAIVREVIGTPGRVDSSGSLALSDLPFAAATVRLGVELVRAMARAGEEMVVTVTPDAVAVHQRVLGPSDPQSFDQLRGLARSAGSDIYVEAGDQDLMARLDLPLDASGGSRA